MTHRPVALPVRAAGIRDALKAERRWANWRYVWRDDRWTKMQFQPDGRAAKSNDPSTWSDFPAALAAAPRFDGISFALGDGWAGIDIDHYQRHPVWVPRFRALGVYSERSPGGAGIKLIGRAARIGGEMQFAHGEPTFTTWTSGRFFTVTGQDGSGDPTADLSAFIATHFPLADARPTRDGYRDAALLSDDALFLQMVGTDGVGDRILALWRGDTSAYGGDHSRADQALVAHLAFWTNYDAERIDRLFRQSGLMRPKWDTASYRRATLGKALR
jgi:primase-polymerase (primpol)-like protein